MNTIGRVEELAEARGLTLVKLAILCDVPYATLRSASRRNTQLNVDTIEQICKGLRITMSDFFADGGN